MSALGKFDLAKKRYEGLEDIQGSGLSFWQDVIRTFFKNKAAVIALIILMIIVILAIVGPYIGYYGFDSEASIIQNTEWQYLPPKIPGLTWIPAFDGFKDGVDQYAKVGLKDEFFIFGTDTFGRDMWVRVWMGVRISLLIGFIATLIDLLIGVTIGGASGYFGGKLDVFIQRILEILSSIPMLIVVIILVISMGSGIVPIIIALGITGWIGMSRMVRGQFLTFKEQEYVYAAKTLGSSSLRIIFKHLLPNTYPTIVIWLMFTIPGAIFYEAFLSFIGLGVALPNASLGTLINDGRQFLTFNTYLLFIPTIILSLIMVTFNLVADGMRDASDPKTRGEN